VNIFDKCLTSRGTTTTETASDFSVVRRKKFPAINAQLFLLVILDTIVIIQDANERFVRAWRGGITIRRYDNGPRELNESVGAFSMESHSGSGADDDRMNPIHIIIL
jgi:hypothetical protein